ncbi:MAG: FHA domain-containing protein [Lentisphaerae bacterium]|nr:FHA domain-containing protein [Lentisphaerota bacterium]
MAGTPKLIVLSSQFRGKQFELTNDMYTVGRSEERDICIKDPSLSSYHCDIIRKGDSFIVRDNNSTNGTRVNDKMITEQVLMNSDIIQFGGIEVLFDADSKEGSRSTTTQRTTTGITITDIDPDTVNLGTAPEQSSPSDRKERFILIAVIAILLIAVLALGGFLFQKGN